MRLVVPLPLLVQDEGLGPVAILARNDAAAKVDSTIRKYCSLKQFLYVHRWVLGLLEDLASSDVENAQLPVDNICDLLGPTALEVT